MEAHEGVSRRLSTILAADVVGYSKMMAADEEATLRTLLSYRAIIGDLLDKHGGRIFNTAGDAVLAEFNSAVEGVRCAISIQEELEVRNAELPDDRKMRFRIGINVGDVMIEGDDLFGDGVNVAARLEGIASPGGVCISASTFEQVKNKLSIGFEDLGPQEVKNIPHPVGAFQVLSGPISVSPAGEAGVAGKRPDKGVRPPRWRSVSLAAAVVLLIGAGAVAFWNFGPRSSAPPAGGRIKMCGRRGGGRRPSPRRSFCLSAQGRLRFGNFTPVHRRSRVPRPPRRPLKTRRRNCPVSPPSPSSPLRI